jgi:O-antigen ligase
MIVVITNSNSDARQQFWGVFGRNTGFLTYLSLYFIFLSAALVNVENLSKVIAKSLIITNVIFSSYILLQFLGKDPIRWSQQDLFGTLGNTNFASSFLGMSAILYVSIIFYSNYSISRKILISAGLVLELFLLLKIGSLQGLAIFASGFAGICITKLLDRFKARVLRWVLFLASPFILFSVIAGICNKGPLASLLFQQSNVYRADYMGTALRMMKENLFFGVGLDSYDGWYRTYRGFISAYRTSLSRTTNTAHNIFLDIGAGGGLPLLLSYLAIVIYVFCCFVGILKRRNSITHFDLGILFVWFAYLVQSFVSINQIGVGVWGWILSGVIVARYWQLKNLDVTVNKTKVETSKKIKSKNKIVEQIPAGAVIVSMIGFCVGLVLSVPPLIADSNLRKALDSGNVNNLINVTNSLGSNSFQMEKSIEVLSSNGSKTEVYNLARSLTERFPRSLFGWQILGANSDSQSERDSALRKIKEIDPWLACFDADPSDQIARWYAALPETKQVELAKWWGLIDLDKVGRAEVLLGGMNKSALATRFKSICG